MKKRILIVDDENIYRLALRLILRSSGFEVSDAINGRDALHKILEAHETDAQFDLLLTDYMMPEMNGCELIDGLSSKGINMPTVVISGYLDDCLTAELLKKGCLQVYSKPFSPEKLVALITTILDSKASDLESQTNAISTTHA